MHRAIFILVWFVAFPQIGSSAANAEDSLRQAFRQVPVGEQLAWLDESAANARDAQELDAIVQLMADQLQRTPDPYYEGMMLHYKASLMAGQGDAYGANAARRQAIERFQSIDRLDKMARQHLMMGNTWANLSEYDSAMAEYRRTMYLATRSGDSAALTGAYVNISTVHHELGDREQELKTMMEALNLSRAVGDSGQLATLLFNLAVFYLDAREMEKAQELLGDASALYERMNNAHGIAGVYSMRAEMALEEKSVDSALVLLERAVNIYRSLGEYSRAAYARLNQAQTLIDYGHWRVAVPLLDSSLNSFETLGEQRYMAMTLAARSAAFDSSGRHSESISDLQRAIDVAQQIGSYRDLKLWSLRLAQLHDKTGNHVEAYRAMQLYAAAGDSLEQLNDAEAIRKMEARFQNDRKELEIKNLEQKQKTQKERLEREKWQRMALLIGLLISLLLIGAIAYSLAQKRRDNAIILRQKQQVDEQHKILEEKNREIFDSIVYAQRIQRAILPPDRLVNAVLPLSFVLYLPKDVVAGDFYWLEPLEGTVLFAVADCTGHGVPGAMVSVVCHNSLNRAVREFGLTDPGAILDKTRELVVEEFSKSEEEVKDGMDISLCHWHPASRTLRWAGANNPLWIVRGSTPELLEEIRPDRQPIGRYDYSKPFTTHHLTLSDGDVLYLLTDGYADQFGGEHGKKLKYSVLKNLLLEMHQLPLNEQRARLEKYLVDWRGVHEQIDDICLLGMRVG